MNIQVVGYKAVDEQGTKMRAARTACVAANVPIPREIEEFFAGGEPDPAGERVVLTGTAATRAWSDDQHVGVIVDLTNLRAEHSDLSTLRFEVEAPDVVQARAAAAAARVRSLEVPPVEGSSG